MMKAKEMREKSIEELEAMANDLLKELYELKCALSLDKKIDKPHLILEKKKTRARILTVLREKKVA